MNKDFISRALCFHGQQMQKIWEDERGAGDMQKSGVSAQQDYKIFLERQKHFTFQDRAKRLKLHQFFARKANDLYNKDLGTSAGISAAEQSSDKVKKTLAVVPPYEVFVNKQQDKVKLGRCLLEAIRPGDIVYGVVTRASTALITVKPLCTAEPLVRYLKDIAIKATILSSNLGAIPLDKRGKPRTYQFNEFVCCEVLEISVDADRLNLGMEGVLTTNKSIRLGAVSSKDLPAYYCKTTELASDRYEECLRGTQEFLNPNYDVLYALNGLCVNDNFSMMGALKYPFPRHDYAKELRQTQASKWAFRSVADGIEHFKIGHHVEAFQCLNKALNIDPRNVEGLVARGALYANKGSFLKAVDDFEKALKLNSYHVNARKYMGETLVALGRSYEEDNRIQDAAKAYADCLNIIPNHEQARLLLEMIQQRNGAHHVYDVEFGAVSSTTGNLGGYPPYNNAGAADSSAAAAADKKEPHKRPSASPSSEDSSTESSSNSDTENTDDSRGRYSKERRSLSPMSKRMALHAASMQRSFCSLETSRNPNEFKLDDDDTETRVRKLLQDANKHRREKTRSRAKTSKKMKRRSKSIENVAAATQLQKINFSESYNAMSEFSSEQSLNVNLQGPAAPAVKLSFQLKRPVKVDKFGLVRIATPLTERSVTPRSRSRSRNRQARRRDSSGRRSRSPVRRGVSGGGRSRSSRGRRGRSRRRSSSSSGAGGGGRGRPRYRSSRSRTPSRSRVRRSRSRSSRSRSRSMHRRRAGGYRGRRRTPSPFVPRETPPPRRHRSRSRSRSRSRDHERQRRKSSPCSPRGRDGSAKFGNRVWQRPGYAPPPIGSAPLPKAGRSMDSGGRWPHDKFDDGPSIEEIDEIINQAQKERKQEILKRDKNLLKRPTDSY